MPVAKFVGERTDHDETQPTRLRFGDGAGGGSADVGEGIEAATAIGDEEGDLRTADEGDDPEFKLHRSGVDLLPAVIDQVGQDLVEAEIQAVEDLGGYGQFRCAALEPQGGAPDLGGIGVDLQRAWAGRRAGHGRAAGGFRRRRRRAWRGHRPPWPQGG